MYKLIMCSFVLSFVFFGCAGSSPLLKPDQGSRFAYISKHPELSADIQQAIQDGRVIKGMTKEDVRELLGDPSEKFFPSQDKSSSWHTDSYDEGWYYKGSIFKIVKPSKTVFFKNGIVIEDQTSYWYDK